MNFKIKHNNGKIDYHKIFKVLILNERVKKMEISVYIKLENMKFYYMQISK